ncbi:Heterokaryon incompatibility protein [Hyphodiscus hymeniophilus]|uniref:Heterokaryon incompatibility protein n=1 Tax=Hyphodiscus hymeniophilus TaxID=353542 RepID=A0A9P6VHF3_9HELO|nr:Heterokaryon incompatibility protein [Hyphodiscus hymeniophilus]
MPWMGGIEDGNGVDENEGYQITSEISRQGEGVVKVGTRSAIPGNEQDTTENKEEVSHSLEDRAREPGEPPRPSTGYSANEQHTLQEIPYHMHSYPSTPGSIKTPGHHQLTFGLNYEPLDSDRREIRLLSLARETQDEENVLSLKLEKFSLHEAPRFTSLSYAWGVPEFSCQVKVNGQTLFITQNLHMALVRVLRWNQRLYLWADGVCINQLDNEERSSQVAIMGEIYSRATRTAAYLGDLSSSDEDTEGKAEHSAFALMNILSRIWENDPEHALRSTDDWDALQIPNTRDIWISMLSIWTQPWFARAWVLQEVVLAREVYVFFGEAVSNLESLMRFWDLAQNHDVPPPLKYGSIADAEALLGTFKRLRDFRYREKGNTRRKDEGFHAKGSLNIDSPTLTLVPVQAPLQPFNLLQLLVLSRANRATDNRDKVYSLLALANDVKAGQIIPDYDSSNTTAQVYQSVAELYHSKGFGMHVLHHAGLPQQVEDLPTWVPDWSYMSRFPFEQSMYDCTPGTVPRMTFSPATTSITIRGAIIDSYSIPGMKSNFRSLGSTDYGCNDDPLLPDLPNISSDESLRRMIQMSAEMLMSILLGPSYHTGEDTDTVLWKTLVANRGWRGGKPTDMDRSSYDAYVRSYPPSMSSEKNAELRSKDPVLKQQSWPFEKVMQDTHRGRRFGITACGHVGVFPGETRNGDLVVLLPGATMPFVLRRSGDDRHILIGNCYLHGVMDGELVCDAELPLNAEYTELDQYDLPFSIRIRRWAEYTTDKTKAELQGTLDPEGNEFARFQNFYIN